METTIHEQLGMEPSRSAYVNHGCRCDSCRAANRAYVREHKARKRAEAETAEVVVQAREETSVMQYSPAAWQSELEARVPERIHAETYVSREVYGVQDLVALDAARRMGENVLVGGPTGSGKTTMARAYAAKHGLPFIDVPSYSSMTPEAYVGRWVPSGSGFRFAPGLMALATMYGNAVISIDEIDRQPGEIISFLHPFLDRRRELHIPDAPGAEDPHSPFPRVIRAKADSPVLVVATYNPGYRGHQELDHALANRFSAQWPWDYDEGVERSLVDSPTLREVAKELRELSSYGDLLSEVPTNALIETEAWAAELGAEFAIKQFIGRFHEDDRQVVTELVDIRLTALTEELS